MNILKILDNKENTFDRYTIIFDKQLRNNYYYGIGMSNNPKHPQGFCQHIEVSKNFINNHKDKEIKFKDLPIDCQDIIKNEQNY